MKYLFRDKNRVSCNDGIIFTPELTDYNMSNDRRALLKWKFLEKNTIGLYLYLLCDQLFISCFW